MKVTLTVTGHNQSDIVAALNEVIRKVEQGYTSGHDSNTTGSFTFDVDGEEIVNYAIKNEQDEISKQTYSDYFVAEEALQEGETIVGLTEENQLVELD